MVKIRLSRTGRKNYATYKVVVTDSRERAKNGKVIEYIGYYQPHTKTYEIDEDRVQYWLSVGAKPSATIERMLIKKDLIKEDKTNKKTYAKSTGKKATERAAAKAEKAQAKEAPA